MNSIGLPNKGLDRLPRARPAPSSPRCRSRSIVNVMGFTRDEVADARRGVRRARRGRRDRAERLVPERGDGPRSWAPTRPRRRRLIERVRPLTAKPLIVKLTPNATDRRPPWPRRSRGRAPTRSRSINTLQRDGPAPASRASPGSADGPAACPGPAIRAVALAQVAAVAARVEIPIVGMGGVAVREARARPAATPARRSWRWGRRAFATRRRGRGSPHELAVNPEENACKAGQFPQILPQHASTSELSLERFCAESPLRGPDAVCRLAPRAADERNRQSNRGPGAVARPAHGGSCQRANDIRTRRAQLKRRPQGRARSRSTSSCSTRPSSSRPRRSSTCSSRSPSTAA